MPRRIERRYPLPEPQEPEQPFYITNFDRASMTAEKRDKQTNALIGFVHLGLDWQPNKGK